MDLLLSVYFMSTKVSFPDSNIFCLSLRAKFKVIIVTIKMGVISLLPPAQSFYIENRKKIKLTIGKNFSISQSNPLYYR